jgi:hypothetical protein
VFWRKNLTCPWRSLSCPPCNLLNFSHTAHLHQECALPLNKLAPLTNFDKKICFRSLFTFLSKQYPSHQNLIQSMFSSPSF